MIKIGIDAHMIGDHSGGNESYYSNILQAMNVPENCKIYLFLKEGTDDSQYRDKFEIVFFKSKSAFIRNFVELTILCKKLNLDVLHTQYFIPFIRPCKVVCTIHDICFEHFKDIFTKKEYYRQKLLIPYAAKHSEYIFTVSKHAKNDISGCYKIPKERLVVTYNAVNSSFTKLSQTELNEEELREKFEIGSQDYILSVCNLQPRKNLVRLIEAFVAMKKKSPQREEKLVIVGKKAWLFNDILKAAIGSNKDIVFTDYVSGSDLVRLYNAAKVFVYPSFFEGFGIPPLEAMACGTPVAVADATSLPEVVGDAGVYFDPFDVNAMKESMEKLLTDDELSVRFKEKMQMRVEKFSWEISANRITEIYCRVAENR